MPTVMTKPAKKKGDARANRKGNRKHSTKEGRFFSKHKRRRVDEKDEDNDLDNDNIMDSDISDAEGKDLGVSLEGEESELDKETEDEKRQRVAKAYLDKIRDIARREQDDGTEEDEDGFDKGERGGARDTLIARILKQEQLEESGRVRKLIASRVQRPETVDNFLVLVKHRHSVTAVAFSEDDSRGLSVSKDGTILHWDVDSGKTEKYHWPSEEILRSHGVKDPQGRAAKHSKHILALAVSSDGRYLASGGQDRHVHLWDTRTREHIQAFPGHKGPVSCLTYRQGTSELFSGSYDRTIKMWNTDD